MTGRAQGDDTAEKIEVTYEEEGENQRLTCNDLTYSNPKRVWRKK